MCNPGIVETPDLSPSVVERCVADVVTVDGGHRSSGWDRQRDDGAVAIGRSDALHCGDTNAGSFGHRGVQCELSRADPRLHRHALLVDIAHAYRSKNPREQFEITVVLIEVDHLDGGAVSHSAIRTQMTSGVLIAQIVHLESGSGQSGAQRGRARAPLR